MTTMPRHPLGSTLLNSVICGKTSTVPLVSGDSDIQLSIAWLTFSSHVRHQKLSESLHYRQFCVSVDEEEAWLNEKTALVSSEDTGDTLAAVQVSGWGYRHRRG